MDTIKRPKKAFSRQYATAQEEDMVRQLIADYIKSDDIALVQAYYILYALATGQRDNSFIINEFKAMKPCDFVVKYNMYLYTKPIWKHVYDPEDFEDFFGYYYEATKQSFMNKKDFVSENMSCSLSK